MEKRSSGKKAQLVKSEARSYRFLEKKNRSSRNRNVKRKRNWGELGGGATKAEGQERPKIDQGKRRVGGHKRKLPESGGRGSGKSGSKKARYAKRTNVDHDHPPRTGN